MGCTALQAEKEPPLEADSNYPDQHLTGTRKRQLVRSKEAYCNGPLRFEYAYVSKRGNYPNNKSKPNQDACCVHTCFGGHEDRVLFAVFDGHGSDGDAAALFCRDVLPRRLARRLSRSGQDVEAALKAAFLQTNAELHRAERIDTELSGTTCVLTLIIGNKMYTANVADSRAILATGVGAVVPVALSHDQTPYRRDERERVQAAGARVFSKAERDGDVDTVNWSKYDVKEGYLDPENAEDAPRVWNKDDLPGLPCTRSLGDLAGERIGVSAEPEVLTRTIDPSVDQFILLASDGVWEFLRNKTVVDYVQKNADASTAAQRVADESYHVWMDMDDRSDDITVICCFLKGTGAGVGGAERDDTLM